MTVFRNHTRVIAPAADSDTYTPMAAADIPRTAHETTGVSTCFSSQTARQIMPSGLSDQRYDRRTLLLRLVTQPHP